MQVVGQHDPCVDLERALCPCRSDGGAQGLDLIHQQRAAALRQGDGEEDGGACDFGAEVIWHEPTLRCAWLTGGGRIAPKGTKSDPS